MYCLILLELKSLLLSGCLAATDHVKWAVSQHSELCTWARTQITSWQGHRCLSVSVLSSGLRYAASPCTHHGRLDVLHDQRDQLARTKLVSVVLASNRAKIKWGKFGQPNSNSATKAGVGECAGMNRRHEE